MIEQRLLNRINAKKAELDSLRPLPPAALRRLNEEMTIEWIYNSNAIEGNTLSLRETRLILEAGMTIGGKNLREHFEVINHREAIDYVESLAADETPLTAFEVRQIHKLVMTRIDDESAGQLRVLPVRIGGAAHTPPEAWEVSHLMAGWSDWLSGAAQTLHPVERAALAHHRLVSIHPFLDGNGRTARLVMNLILLREGYPPAVVMQANRKGYYRVLSQADQGNNAPLVNFVGRAVERGLTLAIEAGTPQTKPPLAAGTWVPLSEAAKETPYSQEYLSLLARKGRLEAIKRGRNWYTTRQAVEAYRASVAED